MNLKYLVYRIFETKWKRRIFDEAIRELQQIDEFNKNPCDISKLLDSQEHYQKSMKLMDMIL